MTLVHFCQRWLETRWVSPAYAGALLLGLAIFFFGAAVNTMAGWLYVMSGVIFALLLIAALGPPRSLAKITISRQPIAPVHAGTPLWIDLSLENPTGQPRSLLTATDQLPAIWGQPPTVAIEGIKPYSAYRWSYSYPTPQRGIYVWQRLTLRTAAPLGLFWSRRDRPARARAVVYPQVLPLSHCPIVDQIGADRSLRTQQQRQSQLATEGLTRALRPYRWGDPTRLIHWRTSARYGELRVRELEQLTSGQDLVVALDSGAIWPPDRFEQAVIAAATLYRYAQKRGLQPDLWTAKTGLIQGDRAILEALAATQPEEEILGSDWSRDRPLLWLTPQPTTLNQLPPGSRWLLWSAPILGSSHQAPTAMTTGIAAPGLVIEADIDLALQLQGRSPQS